MIFVTVSNIVEANEGKQEYVKPELIRESVELFSFAPGSESRMARTGRLMVSIMIDKEGNVFEPMIEQTNNDRYVKAALKFFEKAKFTPATINGVPVDTWVRFPKRWNMRYSWRSGHVSTKLFNKHLSSFKTEIELESPDEKKLLKYLKKLAGTRHGNHIAFTYLSYARYQYAAKFGSVEDQILAIREMILSSDDGRTFVKSQVSEIELIRLLINSELLGEAKIAYGRAVNKYRGNDKSSIQNLFSEKITEIKELIASDKAFGRKITLNSSGYTFLPLVKKSFTLDQVTGQIETLKLRCTRKFKELKFVVDAEYKIPEKWGTCQLQVIGNKNTQGRVIQL